MDIPVRVDLDSGQPMRSETSELSTTHEPVQDLKRDERRAFILLAVFLAPALAIAIVGGWGFLIWMFQLIYGPPTG